MPASYSNLVYHVVFATKGRQAWIDDHLANRLYPYFGGIIESQRGVLLAAGGMPDHVHLLMSLPPAVAVASAVHRVKGASSRWIHTSMNTVEFAWQTGYSAFTVSRSRIPAVRRYIARQREHHASSSFDVELRRLLG